MPVGPFGRYVHLPLTKAAKQLLAKARRKEAARERERLRASASTPERQDAPTVPPRGEERAGR